MITTIALASCLVFTGLSAQTKPFLLIAQQKVMEFTDLDPNYDLMRPLSRSLEKTAKVVPVIWSTSDSLVSAALRSGEIPSLPDNPGKDDLLRIAGKLKMDYAALCVIRRSGSEVEAQIDLYKKGVSKPIWSSQTRISILKDGVADSESSVMSVAETFATQLVTVPFKELPGVHLEGPVEVGNPTITPSSRSGPDREPLENGIKALRSGDIMVAIALLRDAVDAEPMNPQPRLALIEAYQSMGKSMLAAEEASRAFELMPEEPALILYAAEAWVQGGNIENAFQNVSKVLLKDPRNPAALAALADLHVSKLNLDKAIELYEDSLSIKNDPEIRFRLAQAYALKEEFSRSIQQLEEAKVAGLSELPEDITRRYRKNFQVMDSLFQNLATSIRNILKEAKANPKSNNVKLRSIELTNRIAAFSAYLDAIPPPEKHQMSHKLRALAANLLLQSANGAQRYAAEADLDLYDDADLLQIEALREFASARQQFEKEMSAP
jgi:tetratricopeptide (TPR) repeat protein